MDEDLTRFCADEYPRLVGMLGLYCGNRAVAEELAQESLAQVFRHWRKVRALDDPGAWLRRVAFNQANSYFRRVAAERRARRRAGDSPDVHSDPDGADRHAVRVAIASLPRRQRTALVLRYYIDLPFAEIADLMDCPEPTAKSLVRRALARLREDNLGHEPMEVFDVS